MPRKMLQQVADISCRMREGPATGAFSFNHRLSTELVAWSIGDSWRVARVGRTMPAVLTRARNRQINIRNSLNHRPGDLILTAAMA
jgi:hypothetical protein